MHSRWKRGEHMPIQAAFIVPHPPLIIPEVGRGEEKQIQNTVDAYNKVGKRIAELKPETIVVISPHSVMYSDYIHISPGQGARGDMGRFRAPNVEIKKKYDSPFILALCEEAKKAKISAGQNGEKDASIDHGVMIPLYFVEKYYSDYELVRISISGLPYLDHYRFGQCIDKAAELLNRRIVILASGDLSHKLGKGGPYGFADEGPVFDRQITNAMADGNFMDFLSFDESFAEAAAECGLRSFVEMAGAFDGKSVKSELLSYEGPFGVGYAVCAYTPKGPDEERHFGAKLDARKHKHLAGIRNDEDPYVHLARQSLESFIKTGQRLERPENLPDDLIGRKAGIFVSLKKDGRLRGCIGTISGIRESVADEIIHNAISAGTEDPRFDEVQKSELDSLVYSVDVLGVPEKICSKDSLDARKYGVIVKNGMRHGLLLPNLDGVDTPEQQINIALQKAGISPHEEYTLERFEVVRHK